MKRRRVLGGLVLASLLLTLVFYATPSSAAFLTFVEIQKDGVGGVDGLGGIYSVASSPDGKHIYAAGLDGLAVFNRNSSTGALSFTQVLKDSVGGVDGLAGAHTLAVSPDGKHVYVVGEIDNAVAVFSRDATSGMLTFVEVQKDGVGGVNGLAGARGIAISPDGKQVYAAGTTDNAVAVFSRNATSGALTFVEMQKDGVGGVDGLAGVRGITISPDGKHVYTVGYTDNAVAVFSRNATSGALTFVEVQKDGAGGVDGLALATSATVSFDQKYVYATGINTIVIFSRNITTGALSFISVIREGLNGVDGLGGASWLVVSPDDLHVYVAGGNDNALAIFSRSAATGALTFVEVQKDNVGGVDGLQFINSIAVSPDNTSIYAAGTLDNALAVFRAASTAQPSVTPVLTATSSTTTPGPDLRTGYLPLIVKALSPTPTVIPSPTPTTGPTPTQNPNGPPFGNTLHIDGVDDYATAPHSTDLSIGDEAGESLTIEAWFLADNIAPPSGQVLPIAERGLAYELYIRLGSEGGNDDCVGMILARSAFSISLLSRCTSISPGWHHASGVFNANDGTVSLYLDGQRLGDPFTFGSGIFNYETELFVGGTDSTSASRAAGQIEELRISASARYTGASYNVPKGLSCDAQTRALWHFDEPPGSTTMFDGDDGAGSNCGGIEDTLTGANGAATGP